MSSLFILLLLLLLGVFLQKLLKAKSLTKLSYYLNRFVIYLALPSMVLIYLKDITLSVDFFIPVATAWGVFIFSALVVYIWSKISNYSKEMLIALLMLVAFTNSSFLGIPFTKLFFKENALKYAIIYDQLGSFLILSIFGVAILALNSSKKIEFSLIFIKIITFPSFIALVFTLIFNINYPAAIESILKSLANLLAPAALLSIGLNLVLKIPKDEIKTTAIALFLKLIAIPLVVLICFKLFSLNSLGAKVSIFESAMAPMVTSSMFAIMAGVKPKFVATTLGYGILLSFLTLPIIYYTIESFL